MSTIDSAKRVMSGTFGELWWDGDMVAECYKFTAKYTNSKEAINLPRQMVEDSKVMGSKGTGSMGKAFIKSYTGVCLEGAVIVLACLIYSAFLSGSAPAADGSLPPVTMAWEYIGQLIFNMLILTGLVKGSDRVVREMFSL